MDSIKKLKLCIVREKSLQNSIFIFKDSYYTFVYLFYLFNFLERKDIIHFLNNQISTAKPLQQLSSNFILKSFTNLYTFRAMKHFYTQSFKQNILTSIFKNK